MSTITTGPPTIGSDNPWPLYRMSLDQLVRVYGKAGIPIYWIVNLIDRQIEVYSDPQPDGYATRTDYRSDEYVPVVLDGTVVGQIAVDDILP